MSVNIDITNPVVEVDINDEIVQVNVLAGANGQGVPPGGNPGQVLAKLSGNNYDTVWVEPTAGVPYTGASADVNLGEFGLLTGNIELDTTPTNIPTSQGAMYWDTDAETVALIMNGTVQKVGEDLFFHVQNKTGSTIAKGTCVRFAGTDGNSGKLLIEKFTANGTYPSQYFMGVTAESIDDGEFGKVYHFGKMRNINTNAYQDGDTLYASSTVAGGFQTTAPLAPNNIVVVAAVIKASNNGTLMIRPQIGSNINNDEGVKIVTPKTNETLFYSEASGVWYNASAETRLLKDFPSQSGQSGKYLTTNGATLAWGTVSTANLYNSDGTLTGNRTVTMASNNLNFSGGRIGLNTISPTCTIHISGNDSTNSQFRIGSIEMQSFAVNNNFLGDNVYFNGTSFILRNTGSATWLNFNGTETQIRFANSGAAGSAVSGFGRVGLKINTDGSFAIGSSINDTPGVYTNARFYINSSGDVGINTISPTSKLHVVGSALIVGSSFYSNFTSTGRLLLNSTTESTFLLDVNGTARTGTLTINTNGEGLAISTNKGATGQKNIYIGGGGASTTSASYNASLGYNSLLAVTTGSDSVAIGGRGALQAVTTGTENIAIGSNALLTLVSGQGNLSIGVAALASSVSGSFSVAVGYTALRNSTGSYNVGMGWSALNALTTGQYNVAIGTQSLVKITTHSNNTAIGDSAGRYISGGTDLTGADNSTFIGFDTRASANGNSNEIVIGYQAIGGGSNSATLGNTSITKTILRGAVNCPNLVVIPQSAAPTATAGALYYDSDDNKLKLYDGTNWVDLN